MSSGRAFFVYTGLRIALLLAVGGLLYLVGARGILLLVLAFVISGALSLVWLDRPRAQMSEGVGRAIGRVNDRIDEAAAAEDAPLEQDADAPPEQEADGRLEQEADAETDAGQQQR